MSGAAYRDLVPEEITLPAEHSDAVITIGLEVDAGTGRVVAPGLAQAQAALARGSVDLVRQYCGMWTRWLARSGSVKT